MFYPEIHRNLMLTDSQHANGAVQSFSNMCTSLMHFDCLFSCLNMLVDVYKCVSLLFKIFCNHFVISTFVISFFSFTRKSSKV